MASFLAKLGFKSKNGKGKRVIAPGELGGEIQGIFEDMDADKLRYLAAFSGLLGRVAYADRLISGEEKARIERILERFGELEAKDAKAVVALVATYAEKLAGLENHLYTQEINELAAHDKKREIISCLFAVASADDEISPEENHAIENIATGLLLDHQDFISIRSLYRDKLSFLKS